MALFHNFVIGLFSNPIAIHYYILVYFMVLYRNYKHLFLLFKYFG
ncbi:unnamed protein product [Brassica oleracea var. botrytis]